MSFNKNNPPAFPTGEWSDAGEYMKESHGMSLRDYFAATAMNGVTHEHVMSRKQMAEWCYGMADEMIKARAAKNTSDAEQE